MSEKKRLKRKKLKKKLFTKNRLVILNEDTFEEVFSLRLTLMNVFVVGTLGAVLLILATTYIIAFTPLREYIPGYASTKLKRDATQLALKSDSLSTVLKNNEAYLHSIKRVLTGDLDVARLNKDSIVAADLAPVEDARMQPSEAEMELRREVAKEDKYNLFEKAQSKTSVVLFAPVTGMVTEKYNAGAKRFATEISVANNTPVKAVLNGTVLFSGWTPESGNVMILRHNNGFISVYKRVASLTASKGETVKTGEAIAIAGTNGDASGIRLQFELWKDGHPVDPENFISFE